MFDQTLLESSRFRRAYPLGWLIESAVLAGLVLVPFVRTEALAPAELWRRIVVLPSPPPAPSPPLAAKTLARRLLRPNTASNLQAPSMIPRSFAPVVEELPSPEMVAPGLLDGVPGGLPQGARSGVLNSIIAGTAVPPPATSGRAVARQPKIIRVGGQVEAARLIYAPRPEYPSLARLARIAGTVRLEAVIANDGTIKNLRVLSGHPLLVNAALEAVCRWRYQPTLLNGEPVEVITEIDVRFSLSE